ncbi:alpha/beta fold hydrolase [Myxococcota bacterium]
MTAPALCLLHGFTGSPLSWGIVTAALHQKRTVTTPCLLGHDGTNGQNGSESFDDEVDRLAAQLEAQGLNPIHLAGYSMGARLALGLLVRHQRLVARATLFAVHPGLETADDRVVRRQSDRMWQELLRNGRLDAFVKKWEGQALFGSQQRLPHAVLRSQREQRLSHHPAGLARAIGVLGLGAMPNYRLSLPSLALPIDLVVGALDTRFLRLARAMLSPLPQVRLVVIPRCGHNVPLEEPHIAAQLLR